MPCSRCCEALDAERPVPGGPLRYNEDWSLLRNPENRQGEWWERFKYIPVDDSAETYLTLGNEVRARYEWLGDPNWGEQETDSGGYFWFRTLPTADLHVGDHLRLFGEFIVAPSAGVDPEPTGLDDDVADVLQAFAEIRCSDSTIIRGGRRVLNIGSGRLVSTRYGVNTLQAFDMAEVFLGDEKASLFVLYGRPVDAEVGSFNDDWSRARQGWTVYWTRDLVDAGLASRGTWFLDVYYMGFENTQAVYDQGVGTEQRQTVAGRLHGNRDRWRWDHELFVQFGRFADSEIRAWSLATLFGYTFEDLPLRPELSLQFNTISGDRDQNDGELNTFNPLFPKLKYFGESGVLAPYNLFDLHPGVAFQLSDDVRVSGSVQCLWRYSTDDGVYGAGGRLLRSGRDSDARYVATQYEIVLETRLTDNWRCNAFFAMLPAGQFVRETGESSTIHFVGVESILAY
ncbi:alginate export family protein [Maioricimonas rarisocia]|uniref:alginate export family protein n=1 Tax=Maioricimonas rarisocia TaxID=2528026 RepID=UPI0018D24DAE|nr:alginate export family protein [Maioricimonas rarisocia]